MSGVVVLPAPIGQGRRRCGCGDLSPRTILGRVFGSAALDELREKGERLATRVHRAWNEIQTSLSGSLCDADQTLALDESNSPDSNKLEGTHSLTDGRTADSRRVVQRVC